MHHREHGTALLFPSFVLQHFRAEIPSCLVHATSQAVLAATHFGIDDTMEAFLSDCNLAFAAIFTAEAIIKLSAMGKLYFQDNWNRYVYHHVLLMFRPSVFFFFFFFFFL